MNSAQRAAIGCHDAITRTPQAMTWCPRTSKRSFLDEEAADHQRGHAGAGKWSDRIGRRELAGRAEREEWSGFSGTVGQTRCVPETNPEFFPAKAVPPRLTPRPAASCSAIYTCAARFRSLRRQNSGPNTRAASACLAIFRRRLDTERAPRQALLRPRKTRAARTGFPPIRMPPLS